MSGKTLIVFIAILFQIPGFAIYMNRLLLSKVGDLGTGLLAISIASALLMEFVVFAWVINNKQRAATVLAGVIGYLNWVTYSRLVFVNGEFSSGTEYWVAVSFVTIMSILPVVIVAINSHMIAVDMAKMKTENGANSLDKIEKDVFSNTVTAMQKMADEFYASQSLARSGYRPEKKGKVTVDQLLATDQPLKF